MSDNGMFEMEHASRNAIEGREISGNMYRFGVEIAKCITLCFSCDIINDYSNY